MFRNRRREEIIENDCNVNSVFEKCEFSVTHATFDSEHRLRLEIATRRNETTSHATHTLQQMCFTHSYNQ